MVTLGGTLIDTGTSILNQQISVLITQSHRIIHILGGIGGVAVTLGGIGGTFLIWMALWVVVVTLNHTWGTLYHCTVGSNTQYFIDWDPEKDLLTEWRISHTLLNDNLTPGGRVSFVTLA